jgi:hypothetical protein
MNRISYVPLLSCIPATTDIFCVCTVSLSKQTWNWHCQCFYLITHCQPEPFEIRSYLKESSRHVNSPACFRDKSQSSGRYNTKAYKTKGKGTVHPRTGHEVPEGEEKYSSTLSLTLALDAHKTNTSNFILNVCI